MRPARERVAGKTVVVMVRRVALRFAVVALVTTLLVGCGSDEEATVIPQARSVSATRVEVFMGCYDSVRVEVDESPERVELRAYGKGLNGGECETFTTVSLKSPLGDRRLVDGKTGQTIKVRPEGL